MDGRTEGRMDGRTYVRMSYACMYVCMYICMYIMSVCMHVCAFFKLIQTVYTYSHICAFVVTLIALCSKAPMSLKPLSHKKLQCLGGRDPVNVFLKPIL